jgi:hypothetical protein
MYILDHFSAFKYDWPLLAEKRIPQDFIYLGSFFNVEIWPFPSYGRESSILNVEIWAHLFAEKRLHTNVRCKCGIIFQCWKMTLHLVQEKNCIKYLVSFFNVEIWPPPLLADKRTLQQFLHLGSFFNIRICTSSYGWEDSIFNVDIWPHLLADKGLHTNVRCICGIIFQC